MVYTRCVKDLSQKDGAKNSPIYIGELVFNHVIPICVPPFHPRWTTILLQPITFYILDYAGWFSTKCNTFSSALYTLRRLGTRMMRISKLLQLSSHAALITEANNGSKICTGKFYSYTWEAPSFLEIQQNKFHRSVFNSKPFSCNRILLDLSSINKLINRKNDSSLYARLATDYIKTYDNHFYSAQSTQKQKIVPPKTINKLF